MRMNSAARLFAACAHAVVFAVGAHAQQRPCVTASKFVRSVVRCVQAHLPDPIRIREVITSWIKKKQYQRCARPKTG